MIFPGRRIALIAVIAALLAGLAGFAATRGPLAPPKVGLAKVLKGDLHPSVFGIGTVEARLSYVLGPLQAGRVKAVLVDQGDRVSAGQVVAQIDPVDLDERISASGLGAERAGLAAVAAEAQLREAASREKLAQASANRYRNLEAKHFVSKEMADARQSEADVAKAVHEAADAALQGARSELARLRAERDALLKQRANLKLVSPVDAVVVAREAEPGNTVVAGQAVLRLVDPASLWVKTRIDQAQSGVVAVGQAAQIVLRSRQNEVLSGKVARVELQGDSVTEERLVQVAFDALPANLTLGELAEVTIVQAPVKDGLLVPSAAVKRANQQEGVWRIEDGKTRFQTVKTGVSTLDGQTRIVSGLQEGDEVIVHSTADLTAGLKVRK